jgi:aryl-alcohol dehydrogenase-like predicted oxidoreductase
MKYVKLGSSPLEVSRVCLGSMTWGFQNNQADANIQLDYAQTQGINFIDTAEMYAVPPTKDTYGLTETIIGNWLTANPSRRQQIVLASKIAGPGMGYIRDDEPVSSKTIMSAVDDSLKRLQTDHIDLYQIHWPNRKFPHFSQHWPNAIKYTKVNAAAQTESMLDILQGLDRCVKAGKIGYCGLSNETPWGLNQYLKLAEQHNLPRMVSMQNEFNLLHPKDWPYMMENCINEDVAYLPWSPLAAGCLTGKYLDGARPKGSRWSFEQRNGLFRDTQQTNAATAAYVEVAKAHGISPAKLALGWCDQIEGVTSTIIGATTIAQLEQNIAAFAEPLSAEVLADIQQVLKQYPMPF